MTGAGQGVGRGVVLALAEAGADVVVNDLDGSRAAAVVDAVRELGGTAIASVFDVTDYPSVSAAVTGLGGVDVLVNNAGNAGVGGQVRLAKFVETEPADWEPYLRVNLYGVMHCVRAVLPGMIENRRGRIITIVSDAGRAGGANIAAYGAAKAGAAGLTRSLALETGRYGITVNNISLGTMATRDDDHSRLDAVLQRYVVRRPGLPEDVAPLVVLLASPLASWITGQTYPVNGGFTFAL